MSNINFSNINEAYPVAGVDNDTQGFRDNFSAVKTALQVAKSEIGTLESSTARINTSNNFNGNIIEGAKLKSTTEEFFNGGTITETSADIQFVNGHYQKFSIGANVTFTFTDWPTAEDRSARILVELRSSDGTSRTVRFDRASVSYKILFDQSFPSPTLNGVVLDDSAAPTLIEFWTPDKGETIFANYLGKFSERSYT